VKITPRCESLIDADGVRQYLTIVTTKVSSKGQVVLPAELREQDDIRAGQSFDIERVDAGKYLLRRRKKAPNEGVMEWLLSCPHKGFFTPIESESTDTL
jgi:AbrB family looped-hinge helix DNA binding protein